ncbi:FAD-dependent oxidoreductase [Mucilaginibacter sp.]|uniref:FAD-dependent oxidoreductase n=1 Tax=Mucilaginibacter sp. TaxID=1882438 RepID=UPI0025EDA11A|nr:FAD-dependent oxidoreductase [Mucilaginibacter sp.]
MRILIIGAGLFGTSAANILADKNNQIDLIEAESDIMQLASRVNHNRIHLGYHYLRSIQTAEQSIEGLLSFLFNYGKSVIHQLPNYYAIAREGSKTTPAEFVSFCDNVGIGYDNEYPDSKFLNRDKIEECFKVPEPVWDYERLKKIIKSNLKKSKINLLLGTECTNLKQLPDKTFEATFNNAVKHYDVVINTTYSNINKINKYLGVEQKRLLFENVIIPVFRYPTPAKGLTIMDGPFCSVMPRGRVKNEFLLYHVRQSVTQSQLAINNPGFGISDILDKDAESVIYQQSALFMPFLNDAVHAGYNKTTRLVYENCDDARITELHVYPEVKNYFSVLSGKVTTCIQVALEIKHILQGKQKLKRAKI